MSGAGSSRTHDLAADPSSGCLPLLLLPPIAVVLVDAPPPGVLYLRSAAWPAVAGSSGEVKGLPNLPLQGGPPRTAGRGSEDRPAGRLLLLERGMANGRGVTSVLPGVSAAAAVLANDAGAVVAAAELPDAADAAGVHGGRSAGAGVVK